VATIEELCDHKDMKRYQYKRYHGCGSISFRYTP